MSRAYLGAWCLCFPVYPQVSRLIKMRENENLKKWACKQHVKWLSGGSLLLWNGMHNVSPRVFWHLGTPSTSIPLLLDQMLVNSAEELKGQIQRSLLGFRSYCAASNTLDYVFLLSLSGIWDCSETSLGPKPYLLTSGHLANG